MILYNSSDIPIIDIEVDDNSYRHRTIMGDHSLTLYFSLSDHLELPVGTYCDYQGERFTLERPENLKMKHSRLFEYTVVLEAPEAKAKIWKFRNSVDGRLKFSLTAKPIEHLMMFIDNMNNRDSGWTIGDCIAGDEKCINYDHAFCIDALRHMASTFQTEFEFVGKRVSLKKVEYNKDNPLPLSYGRGNGFRSGVGRANSGDQPPIEILYVQGSSRNLIPSKYGSLELLLPKSQIIAYDGDKFENETGFVEANARRYITDTDGRSVRRLDQPQSSLSEDSLDCSEIYPKREGVVSNVIVVNEEKYLYDIVDKDIPQSLDYEKCLIEGENMTVIFQSGMLAGKQFDVKYCHDAKTINGVTKERRRFEIIPQEIDGVTMPNAAFSPKAGDKYVVLNCMLPDAYICDNATKSGASWDMYRAAVKYLYNNEDPKFTFSGELDGIWSKKDWVNIGGRIILGGFILFTDPRFLPNGVRVRIIGIKDYVNKPFSPVIELSNTTVTSGVSSTLKELQSQEVLIEDNKKEAIQYTKRRFRDAKETMSMLENALLDNFTNSISPIVVNTMSMLVGDESLQFRFVNSRTAPQAVEHKVIWNNKAKQLFVDGGIIQHMTLGIKSISPSHKDSEYKFWDVSRYVSAILDAKKKFYLYAKVYKANTSGTFLLSESAIKFDSATDSYHLLVGILNSEYEGERSFATLYGFTEVLPGRITTDSIVSTDGNSYFNMLQNAFRLGNALSFNEKGDNVLRLRGTLIQSPSGDENALGCYRGVFDPQVTYYKGDEVSYSDGGRTSTYRYIFATEASGILPTDKTYWQVIAEGSVGQDGKDGKGAAMVFRGDYDDREVYYGTPVRVDCVRVGDAAYIAKSDAGAFSGRRPPNAQFWDDFGASFESVATRLLLAEGANIANFIFRNQRMESHGQTNGIANIILDGLKSYAKLGWLELVGNDLIGYDNSGKKEVRLKISNSELPDVFSLSKKEVAKDCIHEYDMNATLNETEQGTYEVTLDGYRTEIRDPLDGTVYDEVNTIYVDITFNVEQNNSLVSLDYLSAVNVTSGNYPNGSYPTSQSITIYNADNYIKIKEVNDSKIEVKLNKGRFKAKLRSVFSSLNDWSGKMSIMFKNPMIMIWAQQTYIGNNGILVTGGGNYLRQTPDLFEVSVGNNGLRVSSSGIEKQVNGIWTNI